MYITTYKNPNTTIQNTTNYLSLFQNTDTNNDIDLDTEITDIKKITYKIEHPKEITQLSEKQQNNIKQMEEAIDTLYTYLAHKYNNTNLKDFYYEFKIPKASGGLRTIDAPNEEFKQDLYKIKDLFDKTIKCLPHDSAYAYIRNRDIKAELQKHTDNQSKWFLKIDLKNFFPSCSLDILISKLKNLYPIYYFSNITHIKLKEMLRLCILNGGLPQGTPTSPFLINLIMVSYDYEICEYLKTLGAGYVYTRYADDILISNPGKFDFNKIVTQLHDILQPFTIKQEKTRFGSSSGRNWNLGLMVNKDNNITLGFRKKQLLNAMLNNFLRDANNNNPWNREDTYQLQGQLSQLSHIEPDYYIHILNKYELKYNRTFSETVKQILNPTNN